MTVVGKVLAVVNLVLSLAVMAFIVMTYVARTNWHTAYDDLQKQVAATQADMNRYKDEVKDSEDKAKTAVDALAKEKMDCQKKMADWDAQVKAEKVRTQQEISNVQTLRANETALKTELDRREQEVRYLKSMVTKRDDELAAKEKLVQDFRSAAVEAQINANSEHERNNNLLVQVENLTKSLQSAQRSGSPVQGGIARKNPPPEDVEGLVKFTDPQSGYVTISLGSDAGIAKGNTMEVYRLKPEAAYLGTIQILAVKPDEAVGKPITRLAKTIQVGDRVSSFIVKR